MKLFLEGRIFLEYKKGKKTVQEDIDGRAVLKLVLKALELGLNDMERTEVIGQLDSMAGPKKRRKSK